MFMALPKTVGIIIVIKDLAGRLCDVLDIVIEQVSKKAAPDACGRDF